ncbi:MAG: ABC transporter substrate-binding protein [Nitrospirae bacterium]|nr:ABC transporter substrate-binding protein [Nitrospirota bacterium]
MTPKKSPSQEISRLALWFVLFSIITFLSGCTSSNRISGFFYYRLNSTPSTVDPALIADVSGASVAAKLFNGLVRLDDNLSVAPDIAERWKISGDGLRYVFFLRRDVQFSNGRGVRARDFKASFERVLNSGTRSPNVWVFDKVEGAQAYREGRAGDVAGFRVIDDYTFEIKLKRPFSPFLSMLTTTPAYVVAVDGSLCLGTGPFNLASWMPGRELVLERKDHYFDGRAKVRGIVYRIIPEDLTAITEFEVGNLDVISLPATAYSRFRNDKKWSSLIISMRGLNTYYLGMNTSKPPFDDPQIRKAVASAVDTKKILRTFYENRGRPAAGPVPDLLRSWKLDNVRDNGGYDPQKAREIIKNSGVSGMRVHLYITADQDVVDLAEIIQSYLSDAGIEVVLRQLEWSAFKEAVNRGEPELFWLSWWADYPDPENFLFPLFHSSNSGPAGNRTRYCNKTVDALIEQGQFSINKNDRKTFYKQAEELIIKDAPAVFFWHRTDFMVKQPWVKGYKVFPIYTMDKGMEIEGRDSL